MRSRPIMLFSRAVLAALATFIASSGAVAYSDAEFQRLLSSPDDPELNRQFAASAEARGELRHALAALERALAAQPNSPSLLAEYRRVRQKMLPAVTAFTAQVGASYSTNPRQTSGPNKRDDAIVDAAISVEDERTVAGLRLRSLAYAAGQWNNNTSEISAGRANIESGPVFTLPHDTWLHLAPGTSIAWLDDEMLYSEASATATFGGVVGGLTQTLSARYSWRDGNADVNYSDSQTFEILARLVASPGLLGGDYLYLQPRYRFSEPDSHDGSSLILPTVLGPSTLVSRDLSPPSLEEWGARAAYLFPLGFANIYLGAGLSIYERDYDSFVLDSMALAQGVQVDTGEKRRDILIEPTAHIIFLDLLAPKVDLRADYRLEDNQSNDDYRDYRNHVFGLRVVGRF